MTIHKNAWERMLDSHPLLLPRLHLWATRRQVDNPDEHIHSYLDDLWGIEQSLPLISNHRKKVGRPRCFSSSVLHDPNDTVRFSVGKATPTLLMEF